MTSDYIKSETDLTNSENEDNNHSDNENNREFAEKYLDQELNESDNISDSEDMDFEPNRSKKQSKSKKTRKYIRYNNPDRIYKSITIGNQVFSCLRSEDKQFHCEWPDCEKVFGQKANLMRHYSVHGAEKQYKCHYPNCVREFADSSSFNRHLLVHSGEKPFECDWPSCGYRCNDHSALKVKEYSVFENCLFIIYLYYRFISEDIPEKSLILVIGRDVVWHSLQVLR